MKQIRAKVRVFKLGAYSMMITAMFITLSACVQPKEGTTAPSSIVHSSPDVISLQDYQNEKIRREDRSRSLVNRSFSSLLFGWLFGSNPDGDHYSRGFNDNETEKRKREFVRKNGDTIARDLESKKD